jgi:hypothetical protein
MKCCVDGCNFNSLIFYTQQDAIYKVGNVILEVKFINCPAYWTEGSQNAGYKK